MAVQLDPRRAHKAHIIGDILAILTWVNDERALVLMPAHRAQGSPWFVICDSAAYLYDDPAYLAKKSRLAAEVLGMDETDSTWKRIAGIIMNYLPDLIRMPSAQPPEKIVGTEYGEIALKADGEEVAREALALDESDRSLMYAAA